MPAWLGVHGPGESTMPLGFSFRTSATPILSLRNTWQEALQLAQEMDEVIGEAVVVIDQNKHVSI